MGSSQGSIDNIVRSKRKIQNIAVITAIVTCVLTIVLVVTNYHLVALNQNEIEQMIRQQDQMQTKAEASADIQSELIQSKNEIKGLKAKLDAEKKRTQSLTRKLTDTLQLLAQTRRVSEQEKVNAQSGVPPAVPTESNPDKTAQPASSPINTGNADPKASEPADAPSKEIPTTLTPQSDPGREKERSEPTGLPVQKKSGNTMEGISEPKVARDDVSAETKMKSSQPDQNKSDAMSEPEPMDPDQHPDAQSDAKMDDSMQ